MLTLLRCGCGAGPRASLMQRMMEDIVKAAAAGKASKYWLHSKNCRSNHLGWSQAPLQSWQRRLPQQPHTHARCPSGQHHFCPVCPTWLCMPHRTRLSACTCCHAVRPSMLRRFTALMSAPSGATPTDGSSKKAKLARQRSSKEPMMQHNPCAYDPGAEPDGRRVACASTRGSCIPGTADGRMRPDISKGVQRQQIVSGSQSPVHKA